MVAMMIMRILLMTREGQNIFQGHRRMWKQIWPDQTWVTFPFCGSHKVTLILFAMAKKMHFWRKKHGSLFSAVFLATRSDWWQTRYWFSVVNASECNTNFWSAVNPWEIVERINPSVIREGFKNPSNGKIPLRGYPPPSPLRGLRSAKKLAEIS